MPSEEKVTYNLCQGWGCHEHCLVETHVKDGKIDRVQKCLFPGKRPANDICMKGILSAKIPYAKDRILHPLKRVGERGEGKFEQISWDQALDEISAKITEAAEKYGSRSIILNQFWCGYPGDWKSTHNDLIYRLAFAYDASILEYQAVDYGLTFGTAVVNGLFTVNSRRLPEDVGKEIIIWGGNPLGFTRPAASTHFLLDAQERGVKLVHISNLFDVTSARADQWVPVKSGTDGALALGMCSVVIEEGLYDAEFLLDKTSAAYLVNTETGAYARAAELIEGAGEGDFVAADKDGNLGVVAHPMGQPFAGYGDLTPDLFATIEANGAVYKTSMQLLREFCQEWTPEHQETVTGVPAETCRQVAREYIANSPAIIYLYYGLRYPNAVQSNRAILTLALLAGNVGRKGGTIMLAGQGDQTTMYGMDQNVIRFPREVRGMSDRVTIETILESFENPDVQQYKVWLNCMGNPLLNWPNKDMWRRRILPNIDLFVSWEIRMTDTARYADYVLPETTTFERYETVCDTDNCVMYCEPAIEPLGEAKSTAWIFSEIAKRIGVGSEFDLTAEEWQRVRIDEGMKGKNAIVFDDGQNPIGTEPITYDTLKKKKVMRVDIPPMIPEDGLSMDAHTTTTGRFEFYNELLNGIGHPFGDFEPIDILDDERRAEYPLQFYVGRHKYFMQGQFTNIAENHLLAEKQFGVALNPVEAKKRGMVDGEIVNVVNSRGTMRVPLQLRDDIPMGMAHTWYSFDEKHYPNTCCPQDLMHAENTPERETAVMRTYYPAYAYVNINVLGTPQVMTHVAGPYTPEGLWNQLCDVRKITSDGKEA
ncbi:molybdopterin-dependent oxidoreductase [Adlercreutzia sp. ZJ176]|nr:molybdopterin-dependent oxidoreductase [Adlercreutzia sp. ZJ176]